MLKVEENKLSYIDSLEKILQQQEEVVAHLLSLKTTELASKASPGGLDTVLLWTLPDGTATGDPQKLGGYFFAMLEDHLVDLVKGNFYVAIKRITLEIDKLTCESLGEAGVMMA